MCFSLKPADGYATAYYISDRTGNDGHTAKQAMNPLTAWKTLDRLNAFFASIKGGDSVLFKRGERYYGSIRVSKSGAFFAPIYIGAYGKGARPQISGFTMLTGWSQVRPGIYASSASFKGKNVVVNAMHQPMGRFPNKGYFSLEGQNDNKSIIDKQLTSAVNWAGAEVVIRKNRWTIDRNQITKSSEGIISYESGNKAIPTKGYGYFIQDDIRTLDQPGEWYSNEEENKLFVFFGKKAPESYQVMTSTVTNLVDIKGFNNIVFADLHFSGAGQNAFNIKDASNIRLHNLQIDYSGGEAVLASYSPFFTIESSLIQDSWSGGINLDAGCTNALIVDNVINKVGLAAGMGKSGTGTYEGITAFGNSTTIERNSLNNIGYNGIYFGGNSSSARNNYITYFCLTKDDGAGIYIGDWSETVNKTVEGNIIANGIGNNDGTGSSGNLQAEGIYIDDNSKSVKISGNTIFSCANNGIKIHNARDILIVQNTVFNNGVQLRLEQDCYLPSSSLIRNNNVMGNIFFSKSAFQANASYSSHANDMEAFGKIDSNYYHTATTESSAVHASVNLTGKNVTRRFDIFSWTASTGSDKFSTEISAKSVLFEYNAENENKVIPLNQEYMDVYRNVYQKQIILKPYSSVVLFPRGSKIEVANSPHGLLTASR